MNNETPLAQGRVDVDVRAQFEAWFFDGYAGETAERNSDGEYSYMPANAAWVIWQASAKAEREACAKLLDNDADRQERSWNKHVESGNGGIAMSYHTIPRAYAALLRERSNGQLNQAERSEDLS